MARDVGREGAVEIEGWGGTSSNLMRGAVIAEEMVGGGGGWEVERVSGLYVYNNVQSEQ